MILANETADIKKFVVVNASFDPDNLTPAANAQKRHIIDILGQEEFDSLVENFASSGLTEAQDALLPYVQNALFNLCMVDYADSGDMEISDSGFHISTSEDRKTAFQWQLLKFKRACKNKGFNALQDLLKFLWASNTGDYAMWEVSDNRVEYLRLFCNTATEFSKYYNIKDNFAFFLALRDTIEMVEERYIQPIIGQDLYDTLKEEIEDRDISAENVLLLKKINKVVAYKTIAHALPKITSVIDELGAYEIFDSQNLTIEASQAARNEFVSYRHRQADKEGETFLFALRQFLNDNSDDYPDYVVPEASETNSINTQDRGLYSV